MDKSPPFLETGSAPPPSSPSWRWWTRPAWWWEDATNSDSENRGAPMHHSDGLGPLGCPVTARRLGRSPDAVTRRWQLARRPFLPKRDNRDFPLVSWSGLINHKREIRTY